MYLYDLLGRYPLSMSSVRTTITLDSELAAHAREFDVNVSSAARDGIRAAVRRAQAEADRQAYLRQPESDDDGWDDVEAWGDR